MTIKLWSKNFLKSVAIFLAALMTYESLATPLAQASMLSQTAPAHTLPNSNFSANKFSAINGSQIVNRSNEPFRIPASVGSTVEIYAPSKSGRLVYHLQDVHDNVGAQTNLSEMVSLLEAYAAKQGKSLVVAVEGVSGAVDSDSISKLPNQKNKEDVGAALLQAGYMLGEEYAAITHAPGRIKLVGVETPGLYRQNVLARDNSASARSRVLTTVREIRSQLEKLKPHNFNSLLTILEKKRLAVEEGSLPLTDYISFLNNTHPAAVRTYPHISRLVLLHRDEATIDFAKVEKEGKSLVQEVMADKTEKEMERLVADAEALKEGRISPLSYYSILLKQSSHIYPEIQKYTAYLGASEKIDPETLFAEVEKAEAVVSKGLIKHPLALQLYENLRWIELQEKFFSLNLIPQEWDAQRSINVREIYRKHAQIRDFVNEQVGDLGYQFRTPFFDLNDLSTATNGARGFYEAAEARDIAMVENLQAVLNDAASDKTIVAFVAGGFHTPGITKLLKLHGLAYEVIRPQLDTEVSLSEEIKFPVRKVSFLRPEGVLQEHGSAVGGAILNGSPGVTNLAGKLQPPAAPAAGETATSDPGIVGAAKNHLRNMTKPEQPNDVLQFVIVSVGALAIVGAAFIYNFVLNRFLGKGKSSMSALGNDATYAAKTIPVAIEKDGERIANFQAGLKAFFAGNIPNELAAPRHVIGDLAGWDVPRSGPDSRGFAEVLNALGVARPFADNSRINVVMADSAGSTERLASARTAVGHFNTARPQDKPINIQLMVSPVRGFNINSILEGIGERRENITPENVVVVGVDNPGFEGNVFLQAEDPLDMAVRSFVAGRYSKDKVDAITGELVTLIKKAFPALEKGHFTDEIINQMVAAIMA